MLIVQGNRVPDTSRALILAPAWENGYVGRFYKHCYCFCTNCNYTVLVSSKSDGYITLGAKYPGEPTDLKTYPDETAYGTVRFWGSQCYNYTVTDATKDLSVKVESYSGDPDVYINPIVPIDRKNFTAATYNSRNHFWNEELILDPQTRNKTKSLTGVYHICVFGSTSATYKLSAKNEQHSPMLKAGLAESGYLEHEQIKMYYFTDASLMDSEIKVKFDAHVMVGAVRLRARLCSLPDDLSTLSEKCTFTKEKMLEHDPDEKVMRHEASETESPDPNFCSPSLLE